MTNNFAQTKTSAIYAVTDAEDEFIWQDIRDSVITILEESDKYDFSENDSVSTDNNRSYPSTSIGRVYIYGNGFDITVVLKTVSGYYSGFTLDYQDNICIDYETENIDEVTQLLKDVQTELEEVHKYIESVYSQFTDKLICTARFSNGETIYEKVTK